MWLSILAVVIAMAIGLSVAAVTIQPDGDHLKYGGR
jgi:hypothetical protein